MADDMKLLLSVSADTTQMVNAMKKAGMISDQTAKGIEASFNKVGPSAERAAASIRKSMQGTTGDVKNLQFQINDIATGLASGQSPFTIMAQQSGQLSQALGGAGGLAGAARLFGTALSGLVNPVNLVLVALAAATYAATQFFDETEEGGDKATAIIKAQRDAIKQVADQWGDAFPALKAYNDELERQENFAKQREATQAAITASYAETREAIRQLLPEISNFQQLLQGADRESTAAAELGTAYDELAAKIKAGTATAKDLQPVIDKLNAMHVKFQTEGVLPLIEQLQEQGRALDSAAGNARKLTADIDKANAAQKALAETMAFGLPPLQEMTPIVSGAGKFFPSQTEMEAAGEESARAYATGLRKFLATDKPLSHIADLDPGFAQKLRPFLEAAEAEVGRITINSGRRTIERQRQLYDEAIRKYGRADLPGHQVAKPSPTAPHVAGEAADLGFQSEAVRKWAQANAEAYGLVFRVKGEDWHIEEMRTQATKARTAAEKTQFDELYANNAKRLEQMAFEQKVRGDNTMSLDAQTIAIETQKNAQLLLDAAKQQGLVVNDELTAKINAQALAMAQAGLQAQTFTTQQKELTAQQEAFANAVTSTAKTAVSGFVNDLRNGVEAGDAFHNMLDRILDGMINMAIESLFAKEALGGIFKILAGGFGGGTSAFPSAPGGLYKRGGIVGFSNPSSGGKRYPASLWAGAPSMARGGIVGDPNAIPIIAHRGEMVIPTAGVRRGGTAPTTVNNNQSTGPISIDMSQTGLVAASTEDGKQFGLNVQRMIQAELVRESRPGGLLRRVPG